MSDYEIACPCCTKMFPEVDALFEDESSRLGFCSKVCVGYMRTLTRQCKTRDKLKQLVTELEQTIKSNNNSESYGGMFSTETVDNTGLEQAIEGINKIILNNI